MFNIEEYRKSLQKKITKLETEFSRFYGEEEDMYDYEIQGVIKSELQVLRWALKETYNIEKKYSQS